MCIALKAPILAPSAFGMPPGYYFSTQCFWLSAHCFSYMQAMHASWTCCFWQSTQCFWHNIFASNLLCAPTFLPLRCNHTMGNELSEWLLHGNPNQISMLYIQPNPMDLLYVVAIIIIAIKCKNHAPYSCQDNHYSHQMQKIMHHSDEICYFTLSSTSLCSHQNTIC